MKTLEKHMFCVETNGKLTQHFGFEWEPMENVTNTCVLCRNLQHKRKENTYLLRGDFLKTIGTHRFCVETDGEFQENTGLA